MRFETLTIDLRLNSGITIVNDRYTVEIFCWVAAGQAAVLNGARMSESLLAILFHALKGLAFAFVLSFLSSTIF
jgi:hypothetical protein